MYFLLCFCLGYEREKQAINSANKYNSSYNNCPSPLVRYVTLLSPENRTFSMALTHCSAMPEKMRCVVVAIIARRMLVRLRFDFHCRCRIFRWRYTHLVGLFRVNTSYWLTLSNLKSEHVYCTSCYFSYSIMWRDVMTARHYCTLQLTFVWCS